MSTREREAGGARREALASRPGTVQPDEIHDGNRLPPPAARLPRIRAATLDDLATVVDLRIALLREHHENPIYGRLRADAPARARKLFATQLASPDEIVFLAFQGDRAVGILRCVHSGGSPLLHPANYGYISSVYVVPAARRSGVLKAMLDEAVGWCHSRGLTEIRLHSAADHDLSNSAWDALGFSVVEHLRMMPID